MNDGRERSSLGCFGLVLGSFCRILFDLATGRSAGQRYDRYQREFEKEYGYRSW